MPEPKANLLACANMAVKNIYPCHGIARTSPSGSTPGTLKYQVPHKDIKGKRRIFRRGKESARNRGA